MRDGLKEFVKYFAMIVGLGLAIGVVWTFLQSAMGTTKDANNNFFEGLPTGMIVVDKSIV